MGTSTLVVSIVTLTMATLISIVATLRLPARAIRSRWHHATSTKVPTLITLLLLLLPLLFPLLLIGLAMWKTLLIQKVLLRLHGRLGVHHCVLRQRRLRLWGIELLLLLPLWLITGLDIVITSGGGGYRRGRRVKLTAANSTSSEIIPALAFVKLRNKRLGINIEMSLTCGG